MAATPQWKGQNRGAEPESPPWLLRGAAGRITSAPAMAADADLKILRAHYATRPRTSTRSPSREEETPTVGTTPPEPTLSE
ncbi:hypothetical protein [Streptomyces yerevanensis]|uniref:hypothetical protein n=1 Tax=Streptomyces yerevanensis TaxID=66378 RepID=UPI0005240290|nr:hypothetical protein [Streptomyces yerevanensis]